VASVRSTAGVTKFPSRGPPLAKMCPWVKGEIIKRNTEERDGNGKGVTIRKNGKGTHSKNLLRRLVT